MESSKEKTQELIRLMPANSWTENISKKALGLICGGANVNAKDKWNRTALMLYAVKGSVNSVKSLLAVEGVINLLRRRSWSFRKAWRPLV
ncbi:MAG: hypothetical protein IBX55_01155 [Methyloprofundus sp.]|nr:hypothetical protein [Methyloprofundus sp.]